MAVPTRELIDELFAEDVRFARSMTFEQRFLAGPRLFDLACRIAMDGIRAQHPGASEEEVQAKLRQRIAIGEQIDEMGDPEATR